VRLDLGADDAEDPAADDAGVVTVQAAEPQPVSRDLARLPSRVIGMYLRVPVVPLVVVNSIGGSLVSWAGCPFIAAVM
jgi:hypothetical protein